ncbi:MAG TPA: long-chain fatty acid--CoA ligase [Candidatus Binatia bacterium]|nr:long-chain fatty acid--CoA ligase [Candidatus Binatia bacterium]
MHPIHDTVLRYIRAGAGSFDDLAIEVFTHQFERITLYRRYCERRGRTPASVRSWRDIPPVPVLAFKDDELCCAQPERVFLTTGTTHGSERRGRHAVPDLRLYHASACTGLRRFVFPDVDRMPILSLIASSTDAPDSSLSQMITWAIATMGTADSSHAVSPGGIDFDRCVAMLQASEQTGAPLCLMTTTAALLHLLDYCSAHRRQFRLPHGARLVDTGGSKAAPRHLSRKGLRQAIWTHFAIPGYFCVNEYGMAELSSQFYENVIAARVAGNFVHRHLVGPPWTRVRVLDPATLTDVPAGEPGLLCLYDLANAGTALAVMTEDVGRLVDDGFEIHGRMPGAEARGCSLTAAEWSGIESFNALGR